MPVAALYDIHGNLPALEAVLAEFERNQIERVVVGGDVVPGPMWRESLGQLLALDLPVDFIYGNCEIGVLAELDGKDSALTEQVRWTAHQLNAEERRLFDGWPKTLRVNVSGIGEVLFCHGPPRHENEIFTPPDCGRAPASDFRAAQRRTGGLRAQAHAVRSNGRLHPRGKRR
jgi:predicted phosphodiesterase